MIKKLVHRQKILLGIMKSGEFSDRDLRSKFFLERGSDVRMSVSVLHDVMRPLVRKGVVARIKLERKEFIYVLTAIGKKLVSHY